MNRPKTNQITHAPPEQWEWEAHCDVLEAELERLREAADGAAIRHLLKSVDTDDEWMWVPVWLIEALLPLLDKGEKPND
jgi:hypothetical protein